MWIDSTLPIGEFARFLEDQKWHISMHQKGYVTTFWDHRKGTLMFAYGSMVLEVLGGDNDWFTTHKDMPVEKLPRYMETFYRPRLREISENLAVDYNEMLHKQRIPVELR